jgi:uncharacterized protein YqgV (UPF0045/DUF77 family)
MVVVAAALLLPGPAAGQATDYVTVEEEDLIRDAQELLTRVPLFLRFLDNRIVALGLRERTAKEREQTKKDLAAYEAEVRAASKVKDAEVRAKPVNPDIYLRDTTRSELLRGYMQIIDELMDNIDDAFERKLQVREYVEDLQDFLREQLPRLRTLETKTTAENTVLKATIAHSEQAIEECRQALLSLPKTERTPTPPKK